jgi:hypothetical protein
MGKHLVKKRSYRLSQTLDAALEKHLQETGFAHNRFVSEAIAEKLATDAKKDTK